MNSKKTLMTAALPAAVMLGFWIGLKHTQFGATRPRSYEEPSPSGQTSKPVTAEVTSPLPTLLDPLRKPSRSNADEMEPLPPAPTPAPAPAGVADPDAMPPEVQALVDAHQQFRDWLEQ